MAERGAPSVDVATRDESSPGVLLLTSDFGGGTGNHLLQMMERWDLDRWRPEIVAGASRTARIRPPVPVTELPPEPVSIYPVAQALRVRRLVRLMRAKSPAVVHAYFFWSIVYGRLMKLMGVIPRLVENREDMGFGWGRHEYAWLQCTRSVPDRVICVSDAVRSVVLERERMDAERTLVIRNGVSPAPDVPRAEVEALRRGLEVPAEAPVVGMVANLNRAVKGGELFVRVASRVLEEIPDAIFLIVGLGGMDGPLQGTARRLGVHSSVRFTGYTEDVASHYELMDISILTSRTEGLSITLLESMSHGLPVVATRVGGNPEVVEEGATGWLVPPGQIETFAERVIRLLGDPNLRSKLGEAARRRAESNFDIEDVAERYEGVYQSLTSVEDSIDSEAGGPML